MATYLKANNTNDLNLTSSWATTTVPTSTDIGQWDSTVASANATVLGADLAWLGVIVTNPGGNVTINSGNTLTLGTSGIVMSSATVDLSIAAPITMAGAQTWNLATGRTITASGVISGAYKLTKSGVGLAILSNASNSYSNGTTISAGLLRADNGSSLPTTGNLTLSGGVLETGADLTRAIGTGANQAQLTAVNAGFSAVGAAVTIDLSTGTISIPPNGTAGSTLNLQSANSTDNLTFTKLLASSGRAYIQVNSASYSATLTRSVTSTGSGVVFGKVNAGELIYQGGHSTSGGTITYSVYGGTSTIDNCIFNGGTNNLVIGRTGLGTTSDGTFKVLAGSTVTANQIQIAYDSTSTGILRLNGGTTNTLQVLKATGATATLYFDGGILKASGNTYASTFITGLNYTYISSGGAVIDNGGYALTIPVALLEDSGSTGGGLTVQGSSSVTLSNTGNAYTGSTTISAGTLKLGASNVIPNTSLISITGILDLAGFSDVVGSLTGGGTIDNSTGAGAYTLDVGNDNGSQTFSGIIQDTSGTLSLTKSGSGTQTLSGSSSYIGVTTIEGGTLSINTLADGGTNCAIGAAANTASNTIFNNGILSYTGSLASTARLFTIVAGASATINNIGSNSLTFSSTGSIDFSGTNTPATLILGGTLNLGFNPLISDISGSVTNLTKNNNNILYLYNTSSSYTGVTTINSGFITTSNLADGAANSTIGASTSVAGNLVFNGGSLYYTGATVSIDRLFTIGTSGGGLYAEGSINFTLSNAGTIVCSGSGDRTFSINGTGSVIYINPIFADPASGKLSLITGEEGIRSSIANHTFTGYCGIGGTFSVATIQDGGVASPLGQSTNAAANIRFNFSGATLQWTGTSAGSTNRLFSIYSDSSMTYQKVDASGTSGSTLTFSNTGAITYGQDPGLAVMPFRFGGTNTNNNIFAPALSDYNGTTRKLAVEKVDAGRWVLTGTNTYTGTTTVTTGTLFIDGTTATGSAVTVASGATLGGVGTIAGTVTLSSGAVFQPGSIYTGHINTGAFTFDSGSYFYSYLWTVDKTNGCMTSTGAVVCAGNFSAGAIFGSPAAGDVYDIVTASSVTGTFIGKADGYTWNESGRDWRINYTATKVILTDITGATVADVFGYTDSSTTDVFWATSS